MQTIVTFIAQWTPIEVTPVEAIDWASSVNLIMIITAVALAAVGIYKISTGIGRRVISWLSSR